MLHSFATDSYDSRMANETTPPAIDVRQLTQGAGALGFDPRPAFSGFGAKPDLPAEEPDTEGDVDA